jgi:integrase/recombinase XerD
MSPRNLHLDGDPPQIYLSHYKESNRHVPILPALAQELRTHFNGRRSGFLFEANRNDKPKRLGYCYNHRIAYCRLE